MQTAPVTSKTTGGPGFWFVFCLLVAMLGVLFLKGYSPGYVQFANDGPLGATAAADMRAPENFSGIWHDLNTVGFAGGSFTPGIMETFFWLLGPLGFSKLYTPLSLLVLGVGAWFFFKQLRLSPAACVLGALASVLNFSFFAEACWGLGSHAITVGMAFLALAALVDTSSRRRWLRVALAGLAVGMGVMEGADIGAIFSVYVAAFVVYQAWATGEGPTGKRLATGVGRVVVVAMFAGFLAAQTIVTMVTTQIVGIAGTQQDTKTKEQRWSFATQWSLPKAEALGLVIPGLFGYRMDTPQGLPEALQDRYEGGVYWGRMGSDLSFDPWYDSGRKGPRPQALPRYGGGAPYAGILVELIAVWAILQALRKDQKDAVFTPLSRRMVWFWAGVVIFSLPLAFGRFAPFYQLFYAIPYVSTIRNPTKFLFPMNWAVVVLFAYGVNALYRRYIEAPASGPSAASSFQAWWQRVRGFDRRWALGCGAALAATALGWLIYASNRGSLETYLKEVGFEDPRLASAIAGFSIGQVGWFLLFFTVAVVLFLLVISGRFSGPRAKWGTIILGAFIVFDLGWTNQPWIIAWDYHQKYATNPIIEKLRQNSNEQRVAILPFRTPPGLELLNQMYGIEWAQHHFLYYNIQSLDKIQMPRMPQDLVNYETAFAPTNAEEGPRLIARHWQLTNTRYLLGAAGYLDVLNQQLDPEQRRFKITERFALVPRPGISRPSRGEDWTAVLDTNGPFALFEFTGALPRAQLYSNWQVVTNGETALTTLRSAAFDPAKTVLVSNPIPAPAAASQPAGTVNFTSYSPKHITFKAQAATTAVMLLNDRYDPNWKVLVDGKPSTLLTCNYLMRGVLLEAGQHTVEFHYQPPNQMFYVSLAALGAAVVLGLLLAVVKDPSPSAAPSSSPSAPPPVD